jgi:hypothetical protein
MRRTRRSSKVGSGQSLRLATSSSSMPSAALYICGPGAAVRLYSTLLSRKEIGRHSQAPTAIVGAFGFAASVGTQDRHVILLSAQSEVPLPRQVAGLVQGETP